MVITKILFFGASVTAQYKNHHTGEITGYVAYLKEVLETTYSVESISFPSSQYSNMGIFGFAKTLQKRPDIIFFEWHTTGEERLCIETLQMQFDLLHYLGIQMVLLVLPSCRIQEGNQAQKYSIIHSTTIPALDLRYLLEEYSREEILRDEVHTNPNGAKLYAEAIKDYLNDIVLNVKAHDTLGTMSSAPQVIPDKFSNILYREIPLRFELRSGEHLALQTNSDSRIIFTVKRGPQCPTLRVSDINGSREITLVDQWSYYERISNAVEYEISSNQELLIKALSEFPNYSELCPKLSEEDYSGLRPTNSSELRVYLESIYVNMDCLISIKKF